MRRFLAAALMLLAFGGVASAQDDGYANSNVNLRAGPSTGYPVVAVLEAGTPLEIFGCLDEYTWCDVDWRGYRGWVASRYLDYDYRGRRVVVEDYAPRIGVPVIGFEFNDYWGRYYRGRSWYSNNDRWGPPPPRRGGWNGGPPPGGGGGWNGGPPPGGGGGWNGGPPPGGGGGGWNGGGRPPQGGWNGGPPPGGGGGGNWNGGGGNNGNWNGGGGGRPPQGGPPPQQGQRPPQGGGQQGGRPPQGGGQQGGRPPQQAQPPQQPRPPQQAQPQPARPRPGNNQEGGYTKPTGTGIGCLPGMPCQQ